MIRKCSKCDSKLRFATGDLTNGERWVCDNCFNFITIYARDNADNELDPNADLLEIDDKD